jgi:hypothetical protein
LHIPLQSAGLAPLKLNGLKYSKSQLFSHSIVAGVNRVMPGGRFSSCDRFLSAAVANRMLELCFLLSGSLLSASVHSSPMQAANAAKLGKDLAAPQTDGRALRRSVTIANFRRISWIAYIVRVFRRSGRG